MATPSQILAKKKAPDQKGSDKDDKQPAKKNALIDFIAKHKNPSK